MTEQATDGYAELRSAIASARRAAEGRRIELAQHYQALWAAEILTYETTTVLVDALNGDYQALQHHIDRLEHLLGAY
jgi:hypothetical protein